MIFIVVLEINPKNSPDIKEPLREQNISHKIIRNTIYNTVGTFWGILVTLALTPYIINHIGIERFGIWAIVGVLTSYFGLLDFGIGMSFVKYISEFYTKKDYKSINQVVNTGIIFYSIFAILIIVFGLLLISPLLQIFNIPEGLYNEAYLVFIIGVMIFGVSNVLSPFGAIQSGLQRMNITNKIAMAVSIPMIIGTIYFLESGYGLPGLMINNAIILAISSVVNIIIAFKIMPELRFDLSLFNTEMFKKLFLFGYKVQVSKLGGLITFNVDKLLISSFLSISLVGFYQLGSSITQKMRQIPLLLVSALIPAASELEATNDHFALYKIYVKSSKYLAIVSFPLTAFVIITAPLIMLTWMGTGYEKSVPVIQFLAFGYFLNLMGGVASSMGAGVGRPEYDMQSTLILSLLNLILSIVLIIKIGFIGAVIGTTISLSIAAVYLLFVFHKYYLRKPFFSFVRETYFLPLICTIIASLSIYILDYGLGLSSLPVDRMVNLSILGIKVIIFIVVYIIFILKIGYIEESDKRLFLSKINMLKE